MKRFFSCIAALLACVGLEVSAQGLAPDCAAIQAANPAAPDGDYIISPGGNLFQVYCHDMAGNPREYLTLVNTGGGYNYSSHGDVGGWPIVRVTTHYTRVRIDPATLLVNIGDQTFATSTGNDCCYGNTPVTSMPYATAGSCAGWFGELGFGNVDLNGTPFIMDDVFTVAGWYATGSANSGRVFLFAGQSQAFAVQGPVVNLSGGGGCGSVGPSWFGGQLNGNGGFELQLAFTGALFSVDKNSCKSGGWTAFGVFKNQGDCVSYFATGGRNAPQ